MHMGENKIKPSIANTMPGVEGELEYLGNHGVVCGRVPLKSHTLTPSGTEPVAYATVSRWHKTSDVFGDLSTVQDFRLTRALGQRIYIRKVVPH